MPKKEKGVNYEQCKKYDELGNCIEWAINGDTISATLKEEAILCRPELKKKFGKALVDNKLRFNV